MVETALVYEYKYMCLEGNLTVCHLAKQTITLGSP